MLPEEAKDLQKAMPLKNLEGGTGTERMDKNSGWDVLDGHTGRKRIGKAVKTGKKTFWNEEYK